MALPLDTWAPAQFVTQPQVGNPVASEARMAYSNVQNTIDDKLHYKLAGTVIGALLLVYVLQQLGFRFVVAVSTSAGVGR